MADKIPVIDFDLPGARRAGYTDDQIADFLASQVDLDIAAAREAGWTDRDIIAQLTPARTPAPKVEQAPAPKKAGIGDDLKRGLLQAQSDSQMLGATVAGRRLSEIEAAKAKADRGEPLTPWERAQASQYDEAKANTQRQFAETTGTAIDKRREADKLPISPEYKAFKDAGSKGFGEVISAFWKAPGEVLTSLLAESAVATAPSLLAAAGTGIVGGAAVAGGQAYLQGYASKVAELLAKKGVDLNDRQAVMAALSDPRIADEIRSDASLAAIPQSAAAAASMGVAGKVLAPASLATRPVAQQAVNIPAQAAAQGALEAAGEAGSNVVLGEEIEGGKVAIAGIGGASQGPIDAAVFAGRRAVEAARARPRDIPETPAAPTPEQAAAEVMRTDSVDEAIAVARETVSRAELDETVAGMREYGIEADRQQADILDLWGGLNQGEVQRDASGNWFYQTDSGTVHPLRVWDGQARPDTISPALAEAQRAAYAKLGVEVVYFDGVPRDVGFDGAVDPNQPDTIFLSTDPTRNAAMVGAHELTHVLESTVLPDGTSLADLLHQQVKEGLTAEGRAYAEQLFESTAPRREAFPSGPEGDSLHADAVSAHYIREMAADIGAEAPKFQTFLPRVIDAVQTRYGADTAKDVLQRLMAGIRETMARLREFFFRPDEMAEYGQPPTSSQNWVTNLEQIHDTLARMYADRYGNAAQRENLQLVDQQDRAARDRLIRGEEQPATDYSRLATYRRWLGDLDRERRDAARTSPEAAQLQKQIDTILRRVQGDESKLTPTAAGRLEAARLALDAMVNPVGDSPEMARIRAAIEGKPAAAPVAPEQQVSEYDRAVREERERLWTEEMPGRKRGRPHNERMVTDSARETVMRRETGADLDWYLENGLQQDQVYEVARLYRRKDGQTPREALDQAVDRFTTKAEATALRYFGDEDLARWDSLKAESGSDPVMAEVFERLEEFYTGRPKELPGDEDIPIGQEPTRAPEVARGEVAPPPAERPEGGEAGARPRDRSEAPAAPDELTPEAIVETQLTKERIDGQVAEARETTNTEPTDGQKDAGNYLKGRVSFHGLPFVMENPKGSTRSGVDGDGKRWEATLPADYGYLSRTEGADGDQVDAYIGPRADSQRVWVVDQIDPKTGKWDEHKVMLGMRSVTEARAIYQRAFSDGSGPRRIGAITEMSLDRFKDWLEKGDTKSPAGTLKELTAAQKERAKLREMKGEKEANASERAPRPSQEPDLQGLGERDPAARESGRPVLSELRREGDSRLPAVEGELQGLPEGRRAATEPEAYSGAEGQQRSLRAGERLLGDTEGAGEQHAQNPAADVRGTDAEPDGLGRGPGAGAVDASVSAEPRPDDRRAGADDAASGRTAANASRSGEYTPRRSHVALIERRFGDEVRDRFGVEPSALTADEAQYLVNFRDVDALRTRGANAERERSRRLREKGLLASEAEEGGVARSEPSAPGDETGTGQSKQNSDGGSADKGPKFSPRQREPELSPEYAAALEAHNEADAMRRAVVEEGQPLFSPRITGSNPTRRYTPEQLAAFERTGRAVRPRSIVETIAQVRADLGKKLVREIFDPYVGLRERDPEGYLAARMANSSTGAVDMFNTWGTLRFRGNAYDVDQQTGGVVDLIRRLGPEAHDFLSWVAANRAERLKAEDRENLFTGDDIAAMKALNQGTLETPYELSSGETTTSREAAYLDALQRYDVANKNVQDLAVEAGLLKRDVVDELWANPFYVPFYRVPEGDNSRAFVGPSSVNALAKQIAGKRLLGGTEKLNANLWENAFGNWAHMIDAAIRNRAANRVLETAAEHGIARPMSEAQYANLTKAEKASAVWTMREGKKTYWLVDDPFTLKAVAGLDYLQSGGPLMAIGRAAKKILQVGVAADPMFQVRNLIRDTTNSVAVSPIAKNVFRNLYEGTRQQDVPNALLNVARAVAGRELEPGRIGRETAAAVAGGATMRYAAGVDQSFRKADTYLDSDEKIAKFWQYFRRVGQSSMTAMGFSENINRLALYKQLGEQKVPHDLRAYEGRDLSDFTLVGASPIIRHLVELVPYMNAWMQGLYKVGRAATESDRSVALAVGGKVTTQIATRLAFVMLAMTALDLALHAIYEDDEDYRNRNEYDRNANFWFKVGGTEYRIPRGFEVAALSRLGTIWLQSLYDRDMTVARAWKNTLQIVGTQMAFNPTPQLVKPALDLMSNETRTGTPIETMGMERLRPEYRYRPETTLVSRGISEAMNKAIRAVGGQNARGLSPVQLDYLAQAYAGWLGTSALQIADTAVRAASNEPSKPAKDLIGTLTRGMITNDRTYERSSGFYVNMLYQQGDAIKEAYATYRDLARRGRLDEARDYFASNRDLIARYPIFERVTRAQGELNRQIRAVGEDFNLTPEQKRLRIMRLNRMKTQAAEAVFRAAPP